MRNDRVCCRQTPPPKQQHQFDKHTKWCTTRIRIYNKVLFCLFYVLEIKKKKKKYFESKYFLLRQWVCKWWRFKAQQRAPRARKKFRKKRKYCVCAVCWLRVGVGRMDTTPILVAAVPSSHILNKNLSPLHLKKFHPVAVTSALAKTHSEPGGGGGVGGGGSHSKQQPSKVVVVQNNNYSNLDMESLDDMLRKVNIAFLFLNLILCPRFFFGNVPKAKYLFLLSSGCSQRIYWFTYTFCHVPARPYVGCVLNFFLMCAA